MCNIGSIQRIDLRSVWQDEAGFSNWLAENLSRLGAELGMELEKSEREKPVGAFSADIICLDRISNLDVVIENQLTRTDHDHLGKMITYASGLKSSIVIWVAHGFREEHRSAIDWLNEISGLDTRFFGVDLDVFQIGDSACAPHFDIIAKPNDWERQIKRASASSRGAPPDETAFKLIGFWEDVRAYFELKRSQLELGKTVYDHKHYFKFGVRSTSVRAIVENNATKFRVEIFLAGQKKRPEYSRNWIDHMLANRDDIEKVAGETLIWDNPEQNVELSISYSPEPADIDDQTLRKAVIEQIYAKVHRLERAFRPHLEAFVATHGTL